MLVIAEICSPPRMIEEGKYGLKPGEAPGFSERLEILQPAGTPGEGNGVRQNQEPKLLIGSPEGTIVSQLQDLARWTSETQRRWQEGLSIVGTHQRGDVGSSMISP